MFSNRSINAWDGDTLFCADCVLLAVGLLLFLPHYLLGWSWSETFYRAMVFMVVASPCALVASIMPAALSLISNGARNGLLVKGSVFLEKLGNSKIVAMDKTGTITNGKPAVENMILAEGMDENDLHPESRCLFNRYVSRRGNALCFGKLDDRLCKRGG